jgi:capsid protein
MLSDRDRYKVIQNWFIEGLHDDFYPELLDMSILSRQLTIPAYDTPRFADPRWQPRRWDWVDPEKDINARLDEYDSCLTSLTRIAAEKGDDLEEILEERAEENKLLAAFGVEVKPRKTSQTPQTGAGPAPLQDTNDDNESALPSKKGNNGNGRRN